jgi:hypothetical protein
VCSGGPHYCYSLGGKKLEWWWGCRQFLIRRPLPCCEECRGSSGLFFLTVPTTVILLFGSCWLSSIGSTYNLNFSLWVCVCLCGFCGV